MIVLRAQYLPLLTTDNRDSALNSYVLQIALAPLSDAVHYTPFSQKSLHSSSLPFLEVACDFQKTAFSVVYFHRFAFHSGSDSFAAGDQQIRNCLAKSSGLNHRGWAHRVHEAWLGLQG